jgi:chloride channel protein, CIC family
VVGAAVGVLAWFVPALVGGGDALTQQALAGAETVATVSVIFLVRFALGPLSYAAGTPGGLFAPILVLGAQSGFLFANFSYPWVPAITPSSMALAVVGMAAFFTAVVRAPLTGIILVIEMTASFSLFLPMLGACFAAMLVPILLRNAPIYDSLRFRILQRNRK